MNKPWFKFTATNWLSGSIQLLTDAEKGTYIDLMALIWKEGGAVVRDKILARKLRLDYATACDRINSYCELGIMVMQNDELSIKFLTEEIENIKVRSEKNRENAQKRWSDNDSSMRPHANKIREDKTREDKKENNKDSLWLSKAKPEYLDYCERYFAMLDDHGKVTKSMKWKTKANYDAVRLLVEADGATMSELEETLTFLIGHLLDEYIPQVWSVASLRSKWLKVREYMNKQKSKPEDNLPF